MKKIFIAPTIILLAFLWACGNGNGENIIEESGTIEATEAVISSEVSGTIEEIRIDEGGKAEKSDTILIIDHEHLDIQLSQAEAAKELAKAKLDLVLNGARREDIKQAEEQLALAKANYKSAENDKERYEKLYEEQAITKKQYEDAVTRYDVTQAQVNQTEANLEKVKNISRPEEIAQARASYNQTEANAALIKKQIRDSYVTAPSSGYIVNTFVEAGETVSPMTSLVKLADLSTVELVIYIAEPDLGRVKLGQRAEVTTDTYKDKIYTGIVSYISPEAEFTPKNIQTKDERTKLVFAVKIEVPNPNQELKDGMPADAKVYLNGKAEE